MVSDFPNFSLFTAFETTRIVNKTTFHCLYQILSETFKMEVSSHTLSKSDTIEEMSTEIPIGHNLLHANFSGPLCSSKNLIRAKQCDGLQIAKLRSEFSNFHD